MIFFANMADNCAAGRWASPRRPREACGHTPLENGPSLGEKVSPRLAAAALPGGSSLAWSLPNILTYGRVAAVPVVAGCLFWTELAEARWLALCFSAPAGLPDFLDGYFARAGHSSRGLARCLI